MFTYSDFTDPKKKFTFLSYGGKGKQRLYGVSFRPFMYKNKRYMKMCNTRGSTTYYMDYGASFPFPTTGSFLSYQYPSLVISPEKIALNIIPTAGGYYLIQNVHTGLYLSVTTPNTTTLAALTWVPVLDDSPYTEGYGHWQVTESEFDFQFSYETVSFAYPYVDYEGFGENFSSNPSQASLEACVLTAGRKLGYVNLTLDVLNAAGCIKNHEVITPQPFFKWARGIGQGKYTGDPWKDFYASGLVHINSPVIVEWEKGGAPYYTILKTASTSNTNSQVYDPAASPTTFPSFLYMAQRGYTYKSLIHCVSTEDVAADERNPDSLIDLTKMREAIECYDRPFGIRNDAGEYLQLPYSQAGRGKWTHTEILENIEALCREAAGEEATPYNMSFKTLQDIIIDHPLRTGMDCSGLVFNVLDYATDGAVAEYFGTDAYYVDAATLTSDSNTSRVARAQSVMAGDVMYMNPGDAHVMMIEYVDRDRNQIGYFHSSGNFGPHRAVIEVGNWNMPLNNSAQNFIDPAYEDANGFVRDDTYFKVRRPLYTQKTATHPGKDPKPEVPGDGGGVGTNPPPIQEV